MNRRHAIRNVIYISAGVALLPACMQQDKSAVVLKNISVNGSQEEMLAALAESILPKTENFIGAGELKAHEFVLVMVDDCSSPEDQEKFTNGIKAFDKLSHDKFGQIYKSFTPEQKKEFLSAVETKKDIPEEALQFYKTVKKYTVQCFTSSKEYMLDVRKWKMIPGSNFKGCVKIS